MNVDIIGVPLDLGAGRRGVDMGPSAIRYAGLGMAIAELGHCVNDYGNIHVDVTDDNPMETDRRMKHLAEITRVNALLAQQVSESIRRGSMPLVLGGDHSIAVGTIIGVQKELKNIGVIWVDAHGDFNSELTTPSGNLHGMSLNASTGQGALAMTSFKDAATPFVDPHNVVIIGARSIDPGEARSLKAAGVTVFTTADIDMQGMKNVMTQAIEIAEQNTEAFHLSFDVDAVDPKDAPGVGTPVNGGLTYREAQLACEMIATREKLRSFEFVEVNPILDITNTTGILAVELICSVLGKRIMY